jgi:DeoR family transcriptional regulator, aga operon transcriptional repressor
MKRNERLNALLELLHEQGRLDVDDAAAALAASSATIRRDLDHLADQQLLARTRGGAVPNGVAFDLPLAFKASRSAPEKLAIGRAAAALVRRGDVVGFNGGTTTTQVARAVANRPDLVSTGAGGGEVAVTVVTNALNIAHELTIRPHLQIVVVGGIVRSQSYEAMGPLAGLLLEAVALDVAFVGVDAFDVQFGACAHHDREASINQLMAARAKRVVVVADSSKLGHRALARICPTAEVDTLVTDADAPDQLVEQFSRAGVEVVLA